MKPWNYLFLELALILTALSLSSDRSIRTTLGSRRFWKIAGVLFVLWFSVDQLALRAGVWRFPDGGTLRVRLAGLPLEEYLCFVSHTIVTVLVLGIFERSR